MSSSANLARFSLPTAGSLSNSDLARLRFGSDSASSATLKQGRQGLNSGSFNSESLTNSELARLRFGDDTTSSAGNTLRQGRQGFNSGGQGGSNSGGQGNFNSASNSNNQNPLSQSALGVGQNNLQSITSIDNKFTKTAIGGAIVPNIQTIQRDPGFRNQRVKSSGLAGIANGQLSRHFLGLNPTIMESLRSGRARSQLAQLQSQQQGQQQQSQSNSDIFSDQSLNFLRQSFKRQNDIGNEFLGGTLLDDEPVLDYPQFNGGDFELEETDYDYEDDEELEINQNDALAEIIRRLEMLEEETGVPINEILRPDNHSIPILPPPGSVPFLFPEDPPTGHPNTNIHLHHPPNHLLVTPFPPIIPPPDPNHVDTIHIPRHQPKQHFGGVIHDPEVPPPFVPHPPPPLPHFGALPDPLHADHHLHPDPHHGPGPLVHHHKAHHPGKLPKPIVVKV